jgi:hypothetical protein
MSEGSASKLSELLEASRPELQAAVADARRELRELDERRRELDERRQELAWLIARAEAALGGGGAPRAHPSFEPPPPPPPFEKPPPRPHFRQRTEVVRPSPGGPLPGLPPKPRSPGSA